MKIGGNDISNNVDIYAETYNNGHTIVEIRDEKYTRSINIFIGEDGVVNNIGIHGFDRNKIDIKKTKVRTLSNSRHSWRTMGIDGLGVTFHHSRK
tara:strand:+ start:113 stop:397 length:285 start_codon:yes stop_codon:yes gene_type:complete